MTQKYASGGAHEKKRKSNVYHMQTSKQVQNQYHPPTQSQSRVAITPKPKNQVQNQQPPLHAQMQGMSIPEIAYYQGYY